jgi:hypothetical protein
VATCAACGLAIRNGEKLATAGVYVLHRTCQTIPRATWSVTTSEEYAMSDFRREAGYKISDLERALRLTKQDLDRARAALITRTGKEETLREQLEAARETADLNRRMLQNLRDEYETLRRSRGVVEASRSQRLGTALERQAFGLAVGRGIWGFAALISRLWLDNKDDAEARYALLELS